MQPPAATSSAMESQDSMELEDRHDRSSAPYDRSTIAKGISIAPVVREVDSGTAEAAMDKNEAALLATKSTPADALGMKRMGKDQQLIRHFRQMSITSFVALATASWEIGLFVLTPALVDGGVSGMCWSVIWNFVAYIPIYLSLAEMASMAPIAGAQYHWVSEFAPENCQCILSYLTGWTSTIAWQAGNAQGIFIVGSLIQTIILVNDENYAGPAWQAALLAMAAMLIAYVMNVYGSRALPYWQNAVFAIHILAYFAYIIPIWVSAPMASHEQVWFNFQNEGGWSSIGLAVLVGQLTAFGTTTGLDAAAHMSEEVKDASVSVPRSILTVFVVNFALIFPAILTVAYHIIDLDDALNDPTTYPAIYVLRQAMGTRWITAILIVILLLNVASNIVFLAAVTRDLFAFARDKGLPFSNWLAQVSPKRVIPVNAAIFSSVIAILLSCIYIGSPVAFYAITSLGTVALLQCYCLSIGTLMWRRIYHPETLPPSKYSLGSFGVPLNAMAVSYSFYAFFWAFWPQTTPVTAAGFNWASPIFAITLIGAMIYYQFRARHKYFGPVLQVEGRRGD